MPGKTIDLKHEASGRTTPEIKMYQIKNFCLDFSHAIKSAITLGLDPYENIKSLLDLDPVIFHVCDGDMTQEVDRHLNIGEGEFDFSKIFSMIGAPQR